MAQSWEDLLFAHWPIPLERLRPLVPRPLPIDLHEGTAWIGVTAFVVKALRVHWAPPLPGFSSFPELNVRTYVTVGGRPGVYFFSLDAASLSAVVGARLTYWLPYFLARTSVRRTSAGMAYSSERRSPSAAPIALCAEYGPIGAGFHAEPGSLDHFLVERYCLYAVPLRRRVYRAEIHHPPWVLHRAWARLHRNTMAAPLGIDLSGEAVLHFCDRQDVVFWRPRRVARGAGPQPDLGARPARLPLR
jgi:uncharacterized protein YqjF (DUF2071 family)